MGILRYLNMGLNTSTIRNYILFLLRCHHPKVGFQASASSCLVVIPFRGNREITICIWQSRQKALLLVSTLLPEGVEACGVVTGGYRAQSGGKQPAPAAAAVAAHTGYFQQRACFLLLGFSAWLLLVLRLLLLYWTWGMRHHLGAGVSDHANFKMRWEKHTWVAITMHSFLLHLFIIFICCLTLLSS